MQVLQQDLRSYYTSVITSFMVFEEISSFDGFQKGITRPLDAICKSISYCHSVSTPFFDDSLMIPYLMQTRPLSTLPDTYLYTAFITTVV
jgi:hypothetical protein